MDSDIDENKIKFIFDEDSEDRNFESAQQLLNDLKDEEFEGEFGRRERKEDEMSGISPIIPNEIVVPLAKMVVPSLLSFIGTWALKYRNRGMTAVIKTEENGMKVEKKIRISGKLDLEELGKILKQS